MSSLYSKIEALLPNRELMIRTGGRIGHVCFTTRTQLIVLFIAFSVFSWGVFSSGMYLFHQDILNSKDNNIEEARSAYNNLLFEVAAYRDRVAAITKELENNHNYSIKVIERDVKIAKKKTDGIPKLKDIHYDSSVAAEKAKIKRERGLLQKEMKLLEDKMTGLSKEKTWIAKDIDAVEFELRRAILQKDLASIEKKELKDKVEELEQLVAEMHEAQMQVYERVGDLTEDGISTLEKALSNISKPLKKRGLTIEKLLSKGRKDFGQGGPFIPEELPDLKNDFLNVKIAHLNDRIDLWDSLKKLKNFLPVGKPFEHKIRVTSSFGIRKDPFNGKRARHEGVDLAGRNGTPIRIVAPGKVVRAGRWGWYGNVVEIDHGMGFRTRYAHLKKIYVKRGDNLDIGAKIGLFGSTGRSSGSHLHYEIRIDGQPVNPIRFVRVEKDVFKTK